MFRYFFLSCNEKVIRAKKGLEGLHIMKTVQAIIIAQYKVSMLQLQFLGPGPI